MQKLTLLFEIVCNVPRAQTCDQLRSFPVGDRDGDGIAVKDLKFISRFPKCLMKKVSVARLIEHTILNVTTVLSKKVKDRNAFSAKKILCFVLHIGIQIPIIQCDRGIRTKIAAKPFGIRLIIVKQLQRCRLGFRDITEMAKVFILTQHEIDGSKSLRFAIAVAPSRCLHDVVHPRRQTNDGCE